MPVADVASLSRFRQIPARITGNWLLATATATDYRHLALIISTGTTTLWRTRSAVLPRIRSFRKRWPWVDIAIRSTCSASATRTSSVAGIAQREVRARGEARRGELLLDPLQVGAVLLHLLGLAQLQLVVVRAPPSRRRRGRAAATRRSASRAAGRDRATVRSASEFSMATRMWLYMQITRRRSARAARRSGRR